MSSSTSFYNSNLNVDRVDLSVRVSTLESSSADVSTKLTQLENTKLSIEIKNIPVAGAPDASGNPPTKQVYFVPGTMMLYSNLLCGLTQRTFIISPSQNSAKTLYFANGSIGNSCYFNIDLLSVCRLTGIKNPSGANDAANKQYVDSQISTTVNLGGGQTITGTKTFPQYIKAGWGGSWCRFSPEDNSTKNLYFSNSDVGANCKFTLDLERKVILTNLVDPTNDYDAATKKYVDDKMAPFSAITKSRPKLIQKLTSLLDILNRIPEDRLDLAVKALEALSSTQTNPSQVNPSNNM